MKTPTIKNSIGSPTIKDNGMTKGLVLAIFVFFILGSMVSAVEYDIGSKPQNGNISLWVQCSNCSYVNITSIEYPNQTVLIVNQNSTNNYGHWDYYFSDTNNLGKYTYCFISDHTTNPDGCVDFFITENGRDEPEGIIILIFPIIFLIILITFLITMFTNIIRISTISTDMMDVVWALAVYLGNFTFYYMAGTYFAKYLLVDISKWLLIIGGLTHILLPFIGLVLSMTLGELKKQRAG